MINSSNMCVFEGRLTKDPQISTVGQGQNSFEKVVFTVAVDRKLTKEQRAKAKNDSSVVTADFIPCTALGGQATFINSYFEKGKPIRIVASYNSYQTKDQNGNVKYGHNFKVEDATFTVSDTSGGSKGNSNNGNRNNNNSSPKSNNKNMNEYEVDEDDLPF